MALRVTLFDRFSITAGGLALARLRPRSQRLLVYLILQRGRPVSRRHAAFTLWPDISEDDALGTLRRALNDLRATLEAAGCADLIVVPDGNLHWKLDSDAHVDVLQFERLVAQESSRSLRAAADLYTGDLLPAWDDEWIVVERERLRETGQRLLGRLVAHHRAVGEHGVALAYARRAVGLDPLAEAAQRDLIATLYETGDRAAALAAYERLRLPMAETDSLRAAIVAGQPLREPGTPLPAVRAARQVGPVVDLVGRDGELQQLSDLWEAAAAGVGQLAIVSGEAGVGKSRLVTTLAGIVAGAGGLALTGHCFALEQALPYHPVAEIVRAAAADLQHADLAPSYRAELARFLPDLLGTAGVPAPVGESTALDPRSQLFEALLQALLALSRSRPLLVIIEDLHWAAESTIDWLAYVAPRLEGSPLLVIATYRTDEVSATHALNRLRRRLLREGTISVLVLDRLPADAVHALITAASGLPDERVGPLADRLYAETAGNPFFLHEIVRGLIESGQIVTGTGHWEGPFVDAGPEAGLQLPESLRETIRTRAQRLSELGRVFSIAAAVTGQVFRYEIVRAAGGWDDEAALEGLEDLLDRSFIVETANQGEFSFAHHLVREALYAELSAPRRAYWHSRVADAYVRLANRLPSSEQPGLAARIVHHARAGERADLVLEWAPVAAEQARRVSAYADALNLYEIASEACERLRRDPDIDTAGCERKYVDILLGRSELMPHIGRTIEEHGKVLELARELLARHPDDRKQAVFDLRYADYLADQRQYDRAAEAALRASERCLALGDRRGAGQGRYQAGVSWMTTGRTRAAVETLKQALNDFRAAGYATGEVLSLSAIAIAAINLGRVEDGLQHLQRALELSEQRNDRLGMARASFGLALMWSHYYQADRMRSYAERSMAIYREIGFAWTALRPQLFIVLAEDVGGNVAEAVTIAQSIYDEAHRIEDSWLEGWVAQALGRLAFRRGDLSEAGRWIDRAYELRLESGEVHNQISDLAWLGRLRLAEGDAAAALSHTAHGMSLLDSLQGEYWAWEMPDIYFVHAQALAANGVHDDAGRFLQRAYDCLIEFSAQIADPSVRESYLAFPTNEHIIAAWNAR
jgi:DNA-binding SARP family transcriptional activator